MRHEYYVGCLYRRLPHRSQMIFGDNWVGFFRISPPSLHRGEGSVAAMHRACGTSPQTRDKVAKLIHKHHEHKLDNIYSFDYWVVERNRP